MNGHQPSRWRVTTKRTGPGRIPVEWRSDYGLPRSWRATLEAEHLPYVVELDFVADEHGPICEAMRLATGDGGAPIGARRVREVPVAECIRLAISHAAVPIKRHPDRIEFLGAPQDRAGSLPERWELARPASTSDEHLREVAEVYLKASEKPTHAVEEAFGPISHSTAARWVGHARKRGFIPPA